MNCHYCGAKLEEGRDFCLCCGTRRSVSLPEAVEIPEPIVFPEPVAYEAPAAEINDPIFDTTPWELPRMEEQPLPAPRQSRITAEEWNYAPGQTMETAKPRLVLPDRRSLTKMFFLGIITLGIYPTVIWSRMVTELNILASRHDGRRTMPYFAMAALTPITLGIFAFVWMHRLCNRIEGELLRRDIDYRFGARDFWLWNILGALILVGPFVFVHKITKAMNKLNADFNARG